MTIKKKTPRPRGSANNPRSNHYRRKYRDYFKSINAPCGICGGRLGPIHYNEPADAHHPLSLVIDEIKPISKWKFFGYPSPQAAARDPHNLQPAHRICNAKKGAKIGYQFKNQLKHKNIIDGSW